MEAVDITAAVAVAAAGMGGRSARERNLTQTAPRHCSTRYSTSEIEAR